MKPDLSTVTPVVLISFGHLHMGDDGPQAATRVVDVRESLPDPTLSLGLRHLTGTHQRVRRAVLDVPGARWLVLELTSYVLGQPEDAPRSVAIGCAFGRHRSVALVMTLSEVLTALGVPVRIEHRHIHKPRPTRGD